MRTKRHRGAANAAKALRDQPWVNFNFDRIAKKKKKTNRQKPRKR